MALTYNALGNTPNTINRIVTSDATVADGDLRSMRVSNYGVPTPVGFFGANYIGDFDNPLFFRRLLAATMQFIGATTPEQVSGLASLPLYFFQIQPGVNPPLEAALALAFPNGRFLEAPFFENIWREAFNPIMSVMTPAFVSFEDTLGVSAPRWADISMLLAYPSVDVPVDDASVIQVKIFHSLTY
jgi:hypothetical protein